MLLLPQRALVVCKKGETYLQIMVPLRSSVISIASLSGSNTIPSELPSIVVAACYFLMEESGVSA
jgi:hypothetical protein